MISFIVEFLHFQYLYLFFFFINLNNSTRRTAGGIRAIVLHYIFMQFDIYFLLQTQSDLFTTTMPKIHTKKRPKTVGILLKEKKDFFCSNYAYVSFVS